MAGGIDAMARYMWDARRARQKHANLPAALHPGSIAEAYQAQEAYCRLAEPVYGPVAGVKVATTTKVMQELMRHSSLRSTLDVYTQAVGPAKRAAQAAVLSLLFPIAGTDLDSEILGTA